MAEFLKDPLVIADSEFASRLIIGTGKLSSDSLIPEIVKAAGAEIITVAMRRVEKGQKGVISYIPENIRLLPNTSGARNALEAVRLAKIAQSSGCGNWIKIEVISDSRYLMPDGYETARATEILAKEGFIVLPYINPDLYVARDCVNAGAKAVMPLGAPIGTNRGLRTKELIGILIEEIDLPIIIDAGIGRPSQACEGMEMGAAAILVNTAISSAGNPVEMANAFRLAVDAGRKAYLAKPGQAAQRGEDAKPSSPLTGFLR